MLGLGYKILFSNLASQKPDSADSTCSNVSTVTDCHRIGEQMLFPSRYIIKLSWDSSLFKIT